MSELNDKKKKNDLKFLGNKKNRTKKKKKFLVLNYLKKGHKIYKKVKIRKLRFIVNVKSLVLEK